MFCNFINGLDYALSGEVSVNHYRDVRYLQGFYNSCVPYASENTTFSGHFTVRLICKYETFGQFTDFS